MAAWQMCLCGDNSTDESWLKVDVLDSVDIEEAASMKFADSGEKIMFRVSANVIEYTVALF